jgi:hypothetical protein
MRRIKWSFALLASGPLWLIAGCHLVPSGGMADRCADIMQQAFPGADINITKREAGATNLTTVVAHVAGIRTDMPPHGPLPRDLAVECRFDSGILTEFRWTAGPLRAAGE